MYEYKFIIYSSADKCSEFGTYKMFFVEEKKKNKTVAKNLVVQCKTSIPHLVFKDPYKRLALIQLQGKISCSFMAMLFCCCGST